MGNRCNIITYSQIRNYGSIDQLLGSWGVCFVLYEWKEHYGHWCLLIKSGKLLEFFDPYGGFPDSQLHHVPEAMKVKLGEDYPYLSRLMMHFEGDLSYNEFQFQKLDKETKDCGRWCILRAELKDAPLKVFADLFKGLYGDQLATFMTTPNDELIPSEEEYDN